MSTTAESRPINKCEPYKNQKQINRKERKFVRNRKTSNHKYVLDSEDLE